MDDDQDDTAGKRFTSIGETQQEARIHALVSASLARATTKEMPPEQLAPLLAECAWDGAA